MEMGGKEKTAGEERKMMTKSQVEIVFDPSTACSEDRRWTITRSNMDGVRC